MTISYPYALDFLSDKLCTRDGVNVSLMRNDEIFAAGSGSVWTAKIAKPLWVAEIDFEVKDRYLAREIDAKIRALEGSRHAFLFADKFYKPASGGDPGATATVAAISADRTAINLSGVTAGFVIMPGDRISINWGTDRVYMGEFAETKVTGGGGNTGLLTVTPWVPIGISVGAAVEMRKPRFKAVIPPDGHTPFTVYPGKRSRGGSIKLIQRV